MSIEIGKQYKYGIKEIKTINVVFNTDYNNVLLTNELCGGDPVYGQVKYLYDENWNIVCKEHEILNYNIQYITKCIGFWDNNANDNNLILNYVREINKNKKNILIVGSFVNGNENEYIKNFDGKKIFVITEPLGHMFHNGYYVYNNINFDIITGCVSNINNSIKLPLYIFYLNLSNYNFENTNNYVKTTDLNKKFCALVNRHDNGNTRRGIYNLLKYIDNIDCPSCLFNNCSNEELNRIGNSEYLKKYLFNICPENYNACIDGYITEKLLYSCYGGSIPIYYGRIDDIDKKIFNVNRIILYDPFDNNSLNNTFNFINNLMNNKEELEKFYRQDVFCTTATDTVNEMINNFKSGVEKLCF
jgi:hypothetical protein